MYAFIVGMERCGTHSAANIIKAAASVPAHVVHEEPPTLCEESRLVYENKDFRTPAFKAKIKALKSYRKNNELICEANHRFSFFSSVLMREFIRDGCKLILLLRNPVPTIISRIATWAHFRSHLDLYPEFYVEELISKVEKREFNNFRLTPPSDIRDLVDLYIWEWMETYKNARIGLNSVPGSTRKIMFCEELTEKFSEMLGFIGMEFFKIDENVLNWSRLKSDSIFPQKKLFDTDVFLTQNRDEKTDKSIIFAKEVVQKNKDKITHIMKNSINSLPFLSEDIRAAEKKLVSYMVPRLL